MTSIGEPDSSKPKDRYQLGELLGGGGQGCTYRALDTETGRAVAVKVIELKGSDGWKSFDLFERECQVLRSLDHPGIPDYLDTFAREGEGKFFLVMELVEGTSLRQWLEMNKGMSEAQLWNILHQSLEIIAYLHNRLPPVIHRDIKPANLIRRPDGRLSLVDFGGVRVALRPEGGSTVVGTFGFMAPEQLHGEATPATDIYGLGATMVALSTGTDPDKLPRRGLKIDLETVLPASNLRSLLQKMLEPDPSDRLCSVAAVKGALFANRSDTNAAVSREHGRNEDTSPPNFHDRRNNNRHKRQRPPLSTLLQVIGSLGYVGLTIIDTILLPIIFFILGTNPRRRKELRAHKKKAHEALGRGRKAMRQLVNDHHLYEDRLPPGRKPPPQLPPHPGQNQRGRRARSPRCGRRGRRKR